jgi:type II secretory pathway pseudopilin PulG
MKQSKGFTLIEVIIIMVLMVVAAAFFVTYIGSAYTRSPAAAGLVGDHYKLVGQMEMLTGHYRKALENGGGTIADLCAFKTTYVDPLVIDGVSIVDSSNTSCTYTMTDSTGAYTTESSRALLVTLTYKGQRLQTIFTR